MLCRVLAEDSGRISLPPWLSPRSPEEVTDGRKPGRNAPSSTDFDELQSRQEELTKRLEQATKEAWAQGYQAGEAAARNSLEGELRETTAALASSISEIAAQRPETIRRAEGDTVRLALAIARRVLHREVSIDPGSLSALVGAALEKLRDQEIYRVRIHPDLALVLKTALEKFGRGPDIEVLAAGNLSRGTVTFEVSRGALDASVDTQLREIERGLVDEIRTRS